MDLAKVGKKLNQHKTRLNQLRSIHTGFCRNLTKIDLKTHFKWNRATQAQRKMNFWDESKVSSLSTALSNRLELWEKPPSPFIHVLELAFHFYPHKIYFIHDFQTCLPNRTQASNYHFLARHTNRWPQAIHHTAAAWTGRVLVLGQFLKGSGFLSII